MPQSLARVVLHVVFSTEHRVPFLRDSEVRERMLAYQSNVEPVRAYITYSANAFAQAYFIADGIRFTTRVDLNLGTIFGGLAILVIAEVFHAGTRLDEDQSLTI